MDDQRQAIGRDQGAGVTDAIETLRVNIRTMLPSKRTENEDALDRLEALVRAAEEADGVLYALPRSAQSRRRSQVRVRLATALRAVKGEET